jgi:signal transduction histidine kinase
VATGGNGLGNMQARLVEDNGRTIVISAPGKGTRIRFVFPLIS